MEAFRLKDVWVHLDGIPILEGVSMSMGARGLMAIIGPNGGGKTTLLRTVLGLIRPSKGEVRLFDLRPEEGRAMVGYMPQHPPFDPGFPITVLELVMMARYRGMLRRYSDIDRDTGLRALEEVGMRGLKDRRIGKLSRGELQRALLARALAREPRLLLLDEPTTAMDPEAKVSFYDLVTRLKARIAIVLVTHDVSVLLGQVDRVACLNRRLFYCGPKDTGIEVIKGIYGYPVDLIALGSGDHA